MILNFNSEIMVFVKWWEILIKQIIKVFLKKGKINFYTKIYIELKRKIDVGGGIDCALKDKCVWQS